jgi:hypothetical protein
MICHAVRRAVAKRQRDYGSHLVLQKASEGSCLASIREPLGLKKGEVCWPHFSEERAYYLIRNHQLSTHRAVLMMFTAQN